VSPAPDPEAAGGDFLDRPDRDAFLDRHDFAAGVLELELVLAGFERFTSTSLGKRALRELAPRTDAGARDALARAREMQALHRLGELPSLAGVTDPLPASARPTRALEELELVALVRFLEACARLREWFASRTAEVPRLCAVAAEIPELAGLRSEIGAVVDERGRVRSDASDLLARLRRDLGQLSRSIDRSLSELMQAGSVRNVLSDGNVHRRGGRPVLAVKAKSAGRVPGIVHDRSQSEQTVFIEPRQVIELGNRLAETRADERREVERVLLLLTRTILSAAPRIQSAARCVSEIELAVVAARYSEEYEARIALQPGDEGAAEGLLLRTARHPLLIEQARSGSIEAVVPIDVRLGAEFDMLIITGPNTGGKTLALKTAGLFALLTRCGLPVPAAVGTTVPLYDRICADIGDEQEISQNLSTFASHLVRIKAGLDHSTERTLVLLDELGGGTDPDEGAALGEAVLQFLCTRAVPTIVSTHLGKLKEFAYRNKRAENACTEFDLGTLAPLYKLHIGTPGESSALAIARRLGLPDEVVDLASERTERRDGELARLMEDVRAARTEAERVRSRAESQLEHVEQRTRDLADKHEDLDRRSELLEQEAQRGLEERVRDAMRQLELARKLLDQLPRGPADAMRERLDALHRHLSGATLTERRQRFLASLAKGTFVYLPRYRQRCIVHKVDKARRLVTARLGSMKVQVSFDEVTWYESL